MRLRDRLVTSESIWRGFLLITRVKKPEVRFIVQPEANGRFSIMDGITRDEMFPSKFDTREQARQFIDDYLAEDK